MTLESAVASYSLCAGKWWILQAVIATISISMQPYDKKHFIFVIYDTV